MKVQKRWYKKWWAIGLFIFLGLIILGNIFGEKNSANEKSICNSPYIVAKNSCCLDNNANTICDSKENPIADIPVAETNSKVYSKTNEGYTISIYDYNFIKKGDDWGTISEIEIGLDNEQGSNTLYYPEIEIGISTSDGKENTKIIDMSEYLESGYSLKRTIKTDFSVNEITEIKTMTIRLLQKYDRVYTSVNFKTNLSEGFK